MYVIATRPGRSVSRSKNNVQKFAVVQSDNRFKFTTDVNRATQFRNSSDLLKAVGLRARTLVNGARKVGVTGDLTWATVENTGVRVEKIYNGR